MYTTAEQAVQLVKPGDRLFIHSAAAAPQQVIRALSGRAHELRDVRIYQMHTEGDASYAAPGKENVFKVNCFFIGSNLRAAVQQGRAEYVPVFLSEIPSLFRKRIIPLDGALIQVSPPDKHGFCSLGVSVDISLSAAESAKYIIAEVNPHMPRAHGGGFIHTSRINAMV